MVIIRKVSRHGDARAINLPTEWLKAYEHKHGRTVDYVLIHLDTDTLTVSLSGEINNPAAIKPSSKSH